MVFPCIAVTIPSPLTKREFQSAYSNPKVACSIAYIQSNYRLASGEYKMFRKPGPSSARIYGHNEKRK
jgi:hypothetical protein